jgi:hypothetical protein
VLASDESWPENLDGHIVSIGVIYGDRKAVKNATMYTSLRKSRMLRTR